MFIFIQIHITHYLKLNGFREKKKTCKFFINTVSVSHHFLLLWLLLSLLVLINKITRINVCSRQEHSLHTTVMKHQNAKLHNWIDGSSRLKIYLFFVDVYLAKCVSLIFSLTHARTPIAACMCQNFVAPQTEISHKSMDLLIIRWFKWTLARHLTIINQLWTRRFPHTNVLWIWISSD